MLPNTRFPLIFLRNLLVSFLCLLSWNLFNNLFKTFPLDGLLKQSQTLSSVFCGWKKKHIKVEFDECSMWLLEEIAKEMEFIRPGHNHQEEVCFFCSFCHCFSHQFSHDDKVPYWIEFYKLLRLKKVRNYSKVSWELLDMKEKPFKKFTIWHLTWLKRKS